MNCLSFNQYFDTKLISTSYDGTIRSFDLENQVSELLYGAEDDENSYLTYHSQRDPSTFYVSGKYLDKHVTAGVGIVDMRLSNKKLAHAFNRKSNINIFW